MQFAVYISDIPMTLKQSQGHQTYNDNVDPKQGYNHVMFKRSSFSGIKETLKFFVVVFKEKICQSSPLEHT